MPNIPTEGTEGQNPIIVQTKTKTVEPTLDTNKLFVNNKEEKTNYTLDWRDSSKDYAPAEENQFYDGLTDEQFEKVGYHFKGQNVHRMLADKQSALDQLGNFAVQALGEVVGGGISGFGALAELPVAIYDTIMKDETDFNNGLMQLGEDIMDWTRKNNPIYRKNPNQSWDVGDFGWWAQNGVSLASTISSMIPAAGTVRGLSWLARATKLAGKVNPGLKYWGKLSTAAVVSRNAENFRESLQTVNEVKEYSLGKFEDDEEFDKALQTKSGEEFLQSAKENGLEANKENFANFLASQAGWQSYKVNSINVVFDAIQLAPLFKGFNPGTRIGKFGTSSGVRAAQAEALGVTLSRGERIMGKVKDYFNPFVGAIGRASTEGVEESINYYGNLSGKNYAKAALNDEEEGIDFGHMSEQAFWGALGGLAHEGVAYGTHKLMNKIKGNTSYDARVDEIKGRQEFIAKAVGDIKAIEASGADPKTKEEQINSVKDSLRFDLGFRASSAGNVDLLLEQINHPSFRKNLIETGVASEDTVDQEIAKTVDDILLAENYYKKYYNRFYTANTNALVKNTLIGQAAQTEYHIAKTRELVNNLSNEVSKLREGDVALNSINDPNLESSLYIAGLQAAQVAFEDAAKATDTPTSLRERAKQESKKLLDKIEEETKKLGGVENLTDLSGINYDIIDTIAKKELASLSLSAQDEVLKEQLSEKGVEKTAKAVQNQIEIAKKEEYEKFVKEHEEKIKSGLTSSEIESLIKSEKNKQKKDWLKARLREVKNKETNLNRQQQVQNQQQQQQAQPQTKPDEYSIVEAKGQGFTVLKNGEYQTDTNGQVTWYKSADEARASMSGNQQQQSQPVNQSTSVADVFDDPYFPQHTITSVDESTLDKEHKRIIDNAIAESIKNNELSNDLFAYVINDDFQSRPEYTYLMNKIQEHRNKLGVVSNIPNINTSNTLSVPATDYSDFNDPNALYEIEESQPSFLENSSNTESLSASATSTAKTNSSFDGSTRAYVSPVFMEKFFNGELLHAKDEKGNILLKNAVVEKAFKALLSLQAGDEISVEIDTKSPLYNEKKDDVDTIPIKLMVGANQFGWISAMNTIPEFIGQEERNYIKYLRELVFANRNNKDFKVVAKVLDKNAGRVVNTNQYQPLKNNSILSKDLILYTVSPKSSNYRELIPIGDSVQTHQGKRKFGYGTVFAEDGSPEFRKGIVYAMMEGINGQPIPTPLAIEKLGLAQATEVANITQNILTLLDSGVSKFDPRVAELENKLKNFIYVETAKQREADPTEEKLSYRIYDTKVGKGEARIKVGLGKVKNAEGVEVKKFAVIKGRMFTIHEGDKIVFMGNFHTEKEAKGTRDIVSLFTKKHYQVDFVKLASDSKYKNYLLKQGILKTNVGTVYDTKGNPLSNFFGDLGLRIGGFQIVQNGARFSITKPTISNNENTENLSSNNLDAILINFLNKFNVTVEEYNDLKEITGFDVIGATDLLYKTVLIKSGAREQSLPKEVAYVAYSFLGKKNKIRTDLIHNIEQLENYQELFNKYKEKNPNLSNYKIKELIVIDYLASAIANNWTNPKTHYDGREAEYWQIKGSTDIVKKLNYILAKIKQFFKSLKSKYNLNPKEVESLLDDIANDILKANIQKFNTDLSKEEKQVTYEETIASDPKAKEIVEHFQSVGLILTGSLSLRKEGTLYRKSGETLHDLDFSSTIDQHGEYFKKLQKTLREQENKGGIGFSTPYDEYMKALKNIPVIEKIKQKYPSYKITSIFSGFREGDFTITGDIDGYVIDLFFVSDSKLDTNERGFQDWQEIFKAKIKMGRAKDMKDFSNYIPFTNKPIVLAQEKGFRHFNFDKINKTVSFNSPVIFNHVVEQTPVFQTTVTAEKYSLNNENITAEEILRIVISNPASKEFEATALILLNNIGKNNINVKLTDLNSAGEYNFVTNTIQLDRKILGDEAHLQKVFLHELTHALTSIPIKRAIKYVEGKGLVPSKTPNAKFHAEFNEYDFVEGVNPKTKEFIETIDSLRKEAINKLYEIYGKEVVDEQIKKSITSFWNPFYGLSKAEEFIAEIMSSTEFRDLLNKTEKTKGTLRRIIDAILKFFGVDTNKNTLAIKGFNTVVNFINESSKEDFSKLEKGLQRFTVNTEGKWEASYFLPHTKPSDIREIFNAKERNAIVNSIMYSTVDYFYNRDLNQVENKDQQSTAKSHVKDIIIKAKDTVVDPNQKDILERTLNNWDYIWAQNIARINRVFQIKIDESEEGSQDITQSDELQKDWDDRIAKSVSTNNSLSREVKWFIMSTPKIGTDGKQVYNPITGLAEYVDISKALPTMISNLSQTTGTAQFLEGLKKLSKFDNSYAEMAKRIQADVNTLNLFISQFNRPVRKSSIITLLPLSDGKVFTKVDDELKKTRKDINIADTWNIELNKKIDDKFYKSLEFIDNLNRLHDVHKIFEGNKHKEDYLSKDGLITQEGMDLVNFLKEFADLAGVNLSKEALIEQVETANTYESIEYIYKTIDSSIGIAVKGQKNNNWKNLTLLAGIEEKVSNSDVELSALNIKGSPIYASQLPSFIVNYFKKLHSNSDQAKDELKNYLVKLSKVPSNRYSNWLWNDVANEGFLNYTVVNGERVPTTVNFNFVNRLDLVDIGGTKNLKNKEAQEYTGLGDESYKLTMLSLYLNKRGLKSRKEQGQDTALIPMLIPSDSGNIKAIEVNRIKLEQRVKKEDGTYEMVKDTFKLSERNSLASEMSSPLFAAVYKTIYQEIERINQAYNLIFDKEELLKGNYVVKTDLTENDINRMIQYYHYKELKYKEDGSIDIQKTFVEAVKDGDQIVYKPTGRAFFFHNMSVTDNGRFKRTNFSQKKNVSGVLTLNDIEGLTINGVILKGAITAQMERVMKDFTQEFIKQEVLAEIEAFKDLKQAFKDEHSYIGNGTFEDFIGEYTLNNYIHNAEMQNFLYGNTAMYKSKIDTNKRAKQVQAPGIAPSDYGVKAFYAATIADVKLSSKTINTIIENIKERLYNERNIYYTESEFKKFSVENVTKGKAESQLEKDVAKIVDPYRKINSGDAQGYITVKGLKEMLEKYGKMNEQMKKIFKQIESGEQLTKEAIETLQAVKPFAFTMEFDETLNLVVPNQIKLSYLPLVPQLIEGTDLQKLAEEMDNKQISRVFFESAHKVGAKRIYKIADEKGNIIDSELTKLEGRSFEYASEQIQLEVPEHLVDAQNLLATQIAKLVIANLDINAKYIVDGKEYGREDLKDFYFNILDTNIKEATNKLIEELGAKKDESGNWTVDNKKLHKLLVEEIESKGLALNYKDAIELKENGQFALPLFAGNNSAKFEAILTSLFTNRIMKQKLPGGSVVLASDLFTKKIKQSEGNIKGIEWSKEKAEDTTLKSYDIEDGKVRVVEVVMGAWSKKFFGEDGNRIAIDDISEDIREMIGYRIPTQAKHSMVVFKVVGFLPEESKGTIIMPNDIVAQMGSDFDIDKLFLMYKNFKRDKDETTGKYSFSTHKLSTENTKEATRQRFEAWATRQDLSKNPKYADIINKYHEKVEEARKKLDRSWAKQMSLLEKERALVEKEAEELAEVGHGMYQIVLKLNKEIKAIDNIINNAVIDEESADEINSLIAKKEKLEQESTDLQAKIKDISDKVQGTAYKEKGKKVYEERIDKARTRQEELHDDVRDIEEQEYAELQAVEFDAKSVYEQNNKMARQNAIIDIYKAILTNPVHAKETFTPAEFDDFKSLKNVIEALYKESDEGINILTARGQRTFRKRNMAGRALKGIAANYNSFGAISQVSKMELAENLGYRFAYRIKGQPVNKYETVYNLDRLKQKYGEVEVKGDYAIINLTKLGWTGENDFTNVDDRVTLEVASQGIGAAVDIVKDPTFDAFNATTYTYPQFHTGVLAGTPVQLMGFFTRQPIIKYLNDKYFSNQKIHGERGKDKSREETRRYFQSFLYKILVDNSRIPGDTKLYKAAEQGKIFLKPEQAKELLGYDLGNPMTFSDGQLYRLLELNAKGTKGRSVDETIEFLRSQLHILNQFNRTKEAGDATQDMLKAVKTDATGAGPTIDVTNSLEELIDKIASDPKIFIGNTNAIKKIYPERFKLNYKSDYPTAQSYYNNVNKLSKEILTPYFIQQSKAFKEFQSTINARTEDQKKAVNKYLNRLISSKFGLFDEQDQERVLGIESEGSLASQLIEYKQKISDKDHIVHKLVIGEKNKDYDVITLPAYNDAILDDLYADQLYDLYTSGNPADKAFVEDLIKYNFITFGLQIGLGSFSRIIPNRILEKIGYGDYLYQKNALANTNSLVTDTTLDRFYRNNSNDRNFVPAINTNKVEEVVPGVLKINKENLDKLSNKEINAPYIVITEATGEVTEKGEYIMRDRLFQKVSSEYIYKMVDTGRSETLEEELEGSDLEENYYYEVNKLGKDNIVEFTSESIFEENRTVNALENLHKVDAIITEVFKNKKTGIPNQDQQNIEDQNKKCNG